MHRVLILFLLLGLGTCTGGAGAPAPDGDEEGYVLAESEADLEQPMFGGMAAEEEEQAVTFGSGGGYGGAGIPSAYRPPDTKRKEELRTWQRSGLAPNTSRLAVGDKEELPLRAMQATVRIDGFRARVVLDCVYENDREEQLEGNFQLRLPSDASPFYLGFGESRPAAVPAAADVFSIAAAHAETWTAPKEARIVPRERASRAYREVVRKQVDPALLEWSGAGVFSARVFPLLPKKFHRIVVGYEVDLLPVGDDLEYRLDLPEKVPDLLVDITVADLPHRVEPATESAKWPPCTSAPSVKRDGPRYASL